MNNDNLPTQLLDNREAMLETLHTAYLFILDTLDENRRKEHSTQNDYRTVPRVGKADQKELGRRLSEYWQINNATP